MKRSGKRTRQVRAGSVLIGGGAPVSVQSMTKTRTADAKATSAEINRLAAAGCEIVRVAVKDEADAAAIARIKPKIRIPLVADIHFNWKLAMASMESGADKIRLNPGNICKKAEVREICALAKRRGIPIRVGLNSGSVKRKGDQVRDMVSSAKGYIRTLEGFGFRDIVVSLKCQNVRDTVRAYREMSAACGYPLHVGMTATGAAPAGIIKSSAAIGSLLLDGIGDTIRISLTDDPSEEVAVGRCLLQSLGLRAFAPEVISCPTCGRCQVDLVSIVNRLEKELASARFGKKASAEQIAVMGCEVNGPGEARQAALGVAFGRGAGLLFKRGTPLRKVAAKDCVKELLKEIRKL
ncbi:MAG: flavodoxin-dependent (E)-4-hydroxy-3-methylbut-2-enyl-diphosphate synthase [Deltaproteobacteria bacterium]